MNSDNKENKNNTAAGHTSEPSLRQSGILLHITSLPSPGPVGTMGREAYRFIDFMADAGMNIWQVLPVTPAGYGDSPYQGPSACAGNTLLIDLPMLEEEGILPAGSCKAEGLYDVMTDDEVSKADFIRAGELSSRLLYRAYEYSWHTLKKDVSDFEQDMPWVRTCGLFYAIKEYYGMKSWQDWPRDIRSRCPEAVGYYSELLKDRINYHIFCQYLFRMQWEKLHDYAKLKGIRLMGDMPIYVGEDSVEVWSRPELFKLDKDLRPLKVAGVPPDYFNEEGQRWGNPLYDWENHEKEDYAWWKLRIGNLGQLFDIVRIDHFLGFARYYEIPAEEETAINGVYRDGPGIRVFNAIREAVPELEFVAEDLGIHMPEAIELLEETGFPGMKVLVFSFYGDEDAPELPWNIKKNTIVYPTIHDINTVIGWWETEADQDFVREMLESDKAGAASSKSGESLLLIPGEGQDPCDIASKMVYSAFNSPAGYAIVQLQDLLKLGSEGRMNTPGTCSGNWSWRMKEACPDHLIPYIRDLRDLTGR